MRSEQAEPERKKAMQAADDAEVLEQIRGIEELIRLARAPEGWALRRILLHSAELRELVALIQELMDAKGEPDAIER